jgi:hypothetical protein
MMFRKLTSLTTSCLIIRLETQLAYHVFTVVIIF